MEASRPRSDLPDYNHYQQERRRRSYLEKRKLRMYWEQEFRVNKKNLSFPSNSCSVLGGGGGGGFIKLWELKLAEFNIIEIFLAAVEGDEILNIILLL